MSKYASELKHEIEESNADKCPYCSQYLVLFEMRGLDRPPPDQEWFGLLEISQAYSVETIEEMLERKFWLKNRLEKEHENSVSYWNEECKKACQKAGEYIKRLSATHQPTPQH